MLKPENEILLSEEEIKTRIKEISRDIVLEFGKDTPVFVIGLLRGCFIFIADLVRELSRQGAWIEEIDFIIASSYNSGTVSSGNVKIERDIRSDIHGRNILIVDDILDTGITLDNIMKLLKTRKPQKIKTCVLLEKPERLLTDIKADFSGFSIPNHFVIGMGLDFDQRYRELPYITKVIEK